MSEPTSHPAKTVYSPQIQTALKDWHRIFLQRDWEKLPELLAVHVTCPTSAPLRQIWFN